MRVWQFALLIAYSAGMALGQVLFKQAAISLRAGRAAGRPLLLEVVMNLPLLGALALYGGLTALWVYILTFTELSKAYPFVALAFVLAPLAAQRLFGEVLRPSFFVGLAAIVIGLIVIGWESTGP
jgi:drug/metabolite transporter (DMT)-like permease